MNQTSVLGRYLWVFRRIVGQMQHDLFHVYTVDQHILMVLRNVRRFFIPEHAHEYPFCSQLASTLDRPGCSTSPRCSTTSPRAAAATTPSSARARRGASAATTASTREDAALIEFLVARAPDDVAHRAEGRPLRPGGDRRLSPPTVGNERRLTALYLLTVADIRGTSPKVWNAWKGKLLEDLYRLTAARARRRAPEPGRRDRGAQARGAPAAQPGARCRATVETPLWTHARAQLLRAPRRRRHRLAHALAVDHVDSPKPVVRARLSPLGEGLQVLVYAPDQPDLFARICGYFDSADFNILDAKVHTTRERLCARHLPGRQPAPRAALPRPDLATSRRSSRSRSSATGPLPEPSRGRVSRRVKSFPITPRVTLRPDERAQRWLLGVSASDRSGLLYSIARVLARHHINLQLAKITTLGERVEDTFLIDGPALQQNSMQLQIETELLDAIGAPERPEGAAG